MHTEKTSPPMKCLTTMKQIMTLSEQPKVAILHVAVSYSEEDF
jgi:hypothetical protein